MSNNNEGLGNKSCVVIIGLISSCIAIFAFVTGLQSLGDILKLANPKVILTAPPATFENENPTQFDSQSNETATTQPLLPHTIQPGLYNLDLTLENNYSSYITKIKSIEVYNDGRMKITLSAYYNSPYENSNLFCDTSGNGAKTFLTLADEINIFPLDGQGFCDFNPNWSISPKAGDVIELFDVFPAISGAAQPFSYTDTYFGKVEGILLIK